VAIARDLPYRLPRCTVIDKYFGVGANAGEMVPRRREPHILHKLGVCFDGLKKFSVRSLETDITKVSLKRA
jgi:hypothetical protein